MIPVSLTTLAPLLQGQLLGSPVTISSVTTDTRKIRKGDLFVALQGERFDGHHFAEQALAQGAAALLVSRPVALDIPQLIVPDTTQALGQLAAWVRQQVPAKVVALTGSSGKTSVKEMTAAILSRCGSVLFTEGNLNNEIGVPLTLLRLTPEHQYAVIELGANHAGEIAYTAALVQAQAALINNISQSHLAGFGSLQGVASAKGEIFAALPPQGIAIINSESQDLAQWTPLLSTCTAWHFSAAGDTTADFYASAVQITPEGTRFTLHTPQGETPVALPFTGRHHIANALAASALALSVGAPLSEVAPALAGLRAVVGRQFPLRLAADKLLLDDSYNANVGSMTAAIATLAEMPGYKVLVVGDMGELGETSVACHQQVGQAAAAAAIDCVLSVGLNSEQISLYSGKGRHYADKAALVAELFNIYQHHDKITFLVKGSRSTAMEQVIEGLQEKIAC
ncbi:MAG: UDP-N-acetylmuramoyl-tripeptide--D-alanyl-D-alanine ligase [Enterobacteriaceae bacterium]